MGKRIAVVTGGIGGLGTAICRALAAAGCTVVAADLGARSERIAAFEAEMQGLDVHFMPVDVGDFDACGALVRDVEARFGALDVLVNAAGITRDVTLRKMAREQWDDVLRINLDSVFHMCRHAVEGMATRGFGRIINISSINGQKGQVGQTNYSAAKAGVIGFTKALAAELATKGVTVNAIAPGYIGTDMVMAIKEEVRNAIIDTVPVKRLGKPEEIGAAVTYLASELAGYVTGATLNVNGGLYYQ